MYGTLYFQDTLSNFIAQLNYPGTSTAALHKHAADMLIPFHAVLVFHHVKFTDSESSNTEVVDAVHVWPEQKDSRGWIIPSQFDTTFVQIKGQESQDSMGNKGDFPSHLFKV
jgi:hypothetical protein